MSDDWSTASCTACGEDIDLTQRHFAVTTQIEAHDPPGHVMSIGYSTQVATYHLHDVPAHLDGRQESVGELIRQHERELVELRAMRARAREILEAGIEWDPACRRAARHILGEA